MIEQALAEMMAEHLAAGYRQRTPGRWGESGDHYTWGPIAPVGKVERLRAAGSSLRFLRERWGAFLAEAFDPNGGSRRRRSIPWPRGRRGILGDAPKGGFGPQQPPPHFSRRVKYG